MSRTLQLALAVATTTLALTSGCHHNGDAAGTTTIRSGTPDGVRVTSAPAPTTDAKASAANRLAGAVCERERHCATTERADVTAEAALLGEAVCVADLQPRARLNVEAWECSPAVARAGFEECLAAIRTETSCGQITLNESSEIRACRPSEICRNGASIDTP